MTPNRNGKPHWTTKILSHARRRGGRVAARGARAATGDAGDWIPEWTNGAGVRSHGSLFPAWPERGRLRRGSLGPKRLGLLHELVPNATIVAFLSNPNNPESARQPAELQEAARAIGLQLVVLTATTPGGIDAAFTAMVQNRVGALLVGSDPFFFSRREQIVALAAEHAIPTIYAGRETAGADGLMSYGNSLADAYRR